MAHRYYPTHLWHNFDSVPMAGNDWKHTSTYAQDVIQQKTLEFIETNKDKPFFAYVPIVIPHAELISPNDSLYKRFEGKFEETPYVGSKGADYGDSFVIWKYASCPKPRATFATMVTRMDIYVGQIMQKLEELGIAENTIVLFASDNGPHQEGGADPDFFNSNGGLKGYKRDLYEGGIRSPFIVSWPGKVAAGSVSNHISAFWDMLPTFAELAKTSTPESTNGISLLPELLGQNNQKQHDFLYWEFHELGGRIAIRMGKWKGVRYHVKKDPASTLELYDLDIDPAETNNIAEAHPEIIAQMEAYLTNARTESDTFSFGNSGTLSGK